MDSRLNGQEADVIQFGRVASKPDRDQFDAAGQTILQLIHRAAGTDFFGRATTGRACRNGAERKTSIRLGL
jgi:hypothetical protein